MSGWYNKFFIANFYHKMFEYSPDILWMMSFRHKNKLKQVKRQGVPVFSTYT